ncbi:TatD family hydrolase [Paenibacillus sp. GCM10027626]|uniref:TatD family hydrolase n=1 Tax=Paenibacillus sp. GCM10027626 TaxID=3273411 RepID=UPI0036362ECF
MSGQRILYVDAHLHVDLYEQAERGALLENAAADGVTGIVAVSMNLSSSRGNQALAERYPDLITPAYGFHPEQRLPDKAELAALLDWIRERHAAGERFAIGEVGLPYYTRTEAEAKGEEFDESPYLNLLSQFVQLAAELDLPIVLHAVYEDADKALDLLERYQVRYAHFHWFKGSEATVSRMMSNGYMISITPDVVYEEEIQQLVRQYPLELLMTETDGPWPFEGPFAGKRTEPGMVKQVAAAIAELKAVEHSAAAEALLNNALRFYRIS